MPNFFRRIERTAANKPYQHHYICDEGVYESELLRACDLVCGDQKHNYTADRNVYAFDYNCGGTQAEQKFYKTPITEADFMLCNWRPIWDRPSGNARLILARLTERKDCVYRWCDPDCSYIGIVYFDGNMIHYPTMPDRDAEEVYSFNKQYYGGALARAFVWAEIPTGSNLSVFAEDSGALERYLKAFTQRLPGPMPRFPKCIIDPVRPGYIPGLPGFSIGDSGLKCTEMGSVELAQGLGIALPGFRCDNFQSKRNKVERMNGTDIVFASPRHSRTMPIVFYNGANGVIDEYENVRFGRFTVEECINIAKARWAWRANAPYYLRYAGMFRSYDDTHGAYFEAL